uniref:Bcl-2/adenovirus E1B 19 kDa-interacting protein 2-like protein n=1 Tax=Gopherus evgoodei TaxID=1825980 RepID=A0A8C4YEP8_9SAUR
LPSSRPLPEEVSEEDLEDSSGEPNPAAAFSGRYVFPCLPSLFSVSRPFSLAFVCLDPSPHTHTPVAPNTLELCGKRHMKKRLPAPDLSLSLDRAEGSVQSGDYPECTPDGSLDINVDELETPSESELLDGPESGHDFEWEDELPRARRLDSSLLEEKLGEGRIVDVEDKDGRKWRIFLTDEREQKVDLSVVEPYKRVISHGGYYGEGLNAIILFASCYLPHSSIPDYQYVMEHLFRYIIGTLEVMVAESYILVCLNGATLRSQIPSFGWIKQCYQTIDRRLRKNLKAMIIVHPTWYIKALMVVFRPFLSSKFGRKVQFVDSLWELSQQIPLEQVHIPDCIRQLDQSWNGSRDTKR